MGPWRPDQNKERKKKGGKHQKDTGRLRCLIKSRNINGVEGSGIFYLEEKNIDTIDGNLPQWVEVDEALEEADAPEGARSQEEEEADM